MHKRRNYKQALIALMVIAVAVGAALFAYAQLAQFLPTHIIPRH